MRDIKAGHEPMIFNSPRIFRAGKVKYKGIVHNVPEYGNIATPFYPGGHLNHYGYDLAPEKMAVKHKRTITLLKKRILADPDDADAYFQLAQSLAEDGNQSDAMLYAVKHLAFKGSEGFNDSVYFLMFGLAMADGEIDLAGRLLTEAEAALPNDVDIAQARVEYGVKIKDVGMIMSGAMRFIQNYDFNQQNPAAKGNRFVYCQTPEKNIFNTFQAMFLLLYDVARLKDRLEKELENVPDGVREKTLADMDREFKRLNVRM
jgi:tetratricopeptide (TPR) repeat protein